MEEASALSHPPDPRCMDVLRTYRDHPLDDGDAVLVIDDEVCLELGDRAELRSRGTLVLLSAASRVQVAIARSSGVLHDSDYALWRDLHADLRDTGVLLLPVRALPAA